MVLVLGLAEKGIPACEAGESFSRKRLGSERGSINKVRLLINRDFQLLAMAAPHGRLKPGGRSEK